MHRDRGRRDRIVVLVVWGQVSTWLVMGWSSVEYVAISFFS